MFIYFYFVYHCWREYSSDERTFLKEKKYLLGADRWIKKIGSQDILRAYFFIHLSAPNRYFFSYKKVLSKGEQEIDGKKYNVEKDVYATVKKGKDPKISVKDDHIVIDNGLKTVSPNIKATSVKATKVKGWFDFGSNQKDKKATKTTDKSQLPVYFWLLCLIPVGLLYLIYLNEKGRRQRVKERRQARQINK